MRWLAHDVCTNTVCCVRRVGALTNSTRTMVQSSAAPLSSKDYGVFHSEIQGSAQSTE